MRNLTPAEVVALCEAFDTAGFWRVRGGGKPHDVCLFGVRNQTADIGKFDDAIGALVVKTDGSLEAFVMRGTTDPGREGAGDGLHPRGVATLCPGQYRGLWSLGVHAKGRPSAHRAFVQNPGVDVRVWRDRTVDNKGQRSGAVYTDARGINLHRASRFKESATVGDWSHGCQVVASPIDFIALLAVAENQVASGAGRTFSYTLFDATPALVSILGV